VTGAHGASGERGAEDWLPGFRWPVPAALSGAVSACRFEQGDVLFALPQGYGDWVSGAPCSWIQVLDPPKSARLRTSEGDGSRFFANWGSPVELEIDRGAGPERLKTSQGRLFTCLWRDDLEAIGPDSTEPEAPVLQTDLQRGLDPAIPTFRAAFASAETPACDGLLLLASLDHASDASRVKASVIRSALEARFRITQLERPPAACGIPDGDRYHPSLVVRGLAIADASEDGVTAVLKSVLYTPGGGAAARARNTAAETLVDDAAGNGEASTGPEAPGRSDRFSLARHGRLVPLTPE
jgi:hypothetical protein